MNIWIWKAVLIIAAGVVHQQNQSTDLFSEVQENRNVPEPPKYLQ
ncbi:hypothetical protein [Priestia abyssalis]|nr:hypothetical protein [Priestia abyssalis]